VVTASSLRTAVSEPQCLLYSTRVKVTQQNVSVTLLPSCFSTLPDHRGTETAIDWQTDFKYRQVPGKYVAGMYLPGRVHQGFASVASSLWPGIKSALHSLVKHKSSGRAITHVYVAGHSLGAAVATLMAYAVQVRTGMLVRTPANCSLTV